MSGLDTRLFIPREGPALARLRMPGADQRHDWAGLVAGMLFFVLVLLGPIMTFHDADQGDSYSGLRQGGYLVALTLAGYCLWARQGGWRLFILPLPLVAVLLWCWISVGWAIDSDASVRRVFLTTTVVFTAFWLVRGLGYERLIALVRIVLALLLVVNFVSMFAIPTTAIQIETGRIGAGTFWRGVMAHKNFAGAFCALTILIYLFDAATVNWRMRILVILGSAFFLSMSVSKTSMAMAMAATVAGGIFQRFDGRKRVFLVIGTLTVTVIGYLFLSSVPDLLLRYAINPQSFTGRGQIWMGLLRYSADHPLLGAGFGSFWNIGEESPIYQYGTGFAKVVTVGHMGYLDLLVTIGYPGMILAVITLFIWPMVRLFAVSDRMVERASLVCALMVFGIGHNFTESSLLERDAIVGVFILLAIAILYTLPTRLSSGSRKRREAGSDVMRTMRKRRRKSTVPV
jgi:O-antigen ligase